MDEGKLVGSEAWARRKGIIGDDDTIDADRRRHAVRRALANLAENGLPTYTTSAEEYDFGRTLSDRFTNFADAKAAMKAARFTSSEYVFFTLCVLGYASVRVQFHSIIMEYDPKTSADLAPKIVAGGVGVSEGTQMPVPLTEEQAAAEFHMDRRSVQNRVASALKKMEDWLVEFGAGDA